MTLIVKMDGTDGLVIESLHEPIKDILWGKYRTPEQVRNFILENWFLPDVEITVHGKGPNWQREIVVKGHQVCRPKSLVCSSIILDLIGGSSRNLGS